MTRLLQRLRRLLGIEPGEGSVVGWSAATLFLVEWASVAVSNASDTLFLKRVGVEYLPVVFLVNSLLLTGTTLAAGRLAARADPKTLLTTTFALLAAVLAALWLAVLAGAPGIATTLVLLSKQIDVIALLMFWTVIGGLLSSRQGKRLVALMTAGGTVGTALGSFASGAFGRLLGIPALLVVAAVAFLGAAAAAIPLARSTPPPLYRGAARALPSPSSPPRLATLWAESSLLRLLLATSFLAGVLGPVLYYEFSCAADLATRTADGEQRLLALYGQLRGWINVGVLVVQVAGSAALFERVGVPLAATLAPVAYLAGFAALGVRFGLPTAMPATMGTGVLDHTVYEPAQRILAALLPQRIRSAATGFVQGPAKRAGAALGSVLILLVSGWSGDPSHLAIVALPVAALWMGLSLLLWRGYPNLLLEAASVRVRDAADDEPLAAALDASTWRTLRGNLDSPDADLRDAACSLFVEAPAAVAAEALTSALVTAPADARDALLGALDRVLGGGAAAVAMAAMPPAVAANLLGVLASRPDLAAVERARLLHLLGLAGSGDDRGLRTVVDAAMGDEAPGVRVAAGLAALRLRLPSAPASGFDGVVAAALGSGEAVSRSAAIAELTSALLPAGGEDEPAWAARLALLASHVALPAPEGDAPAPACGSAGGCVEAADAMAAVAARHAAAVAPLAPSMVALVDDPDARVRAAVLRFVGHARLVAHAGLLAERLSSRIDVEARAARSALEALGPSAADALLHALRHGGRRAREVAPTMLRELRADPAVLAAVVDREIGHGRELLLALGALDASPVSRLVVQRLRERVDESMQSVLELLAAILGDDRIAGVGRSLGRAWNVRDRAVLLEALEALLPAAERSRILPLLEDRSPQRLGAAAAKALGRPWPTTAEALALALASRDPLTTGLVAATVDRRLLEAAVPELDVDAARRVWTDGAAAAGAPAGREVVAGPEIPDTAAGHPARRAAAGGGGRSAMLDPVETMLLLRTLDLFEGLTTRQLSELARVVREVEVPAGQAIVAEGEFDDSMYFIVSGVVRISKGGRRVAELGARDFFGEMSLFDGERRSATATATGDVRLLRLARHDLFEVMEDQPAIGIGICQTLVRRVRGLLDERPAAPGGDD